MLSLRPFGLFLPLLLAACATSVPTVPVDVLYSGLAVPHTVAVDTSVTLVAADDRQIPLKVFYPAVAGPYPLIVLSHGTFSNIDRYDLIGRYWAGQGYVVVLPQHKDADYGVVPSSFAVMQDLAISRTLDMTLVLDELDAIEAQIPALTGRVERGEFVAAGHSMGTQVAMLETGMQFRTVFDGELQSASESRFTALVLISDPGKMRLMPADTWLGSNVPTFMATGTDDYGLMGSREKASDSQSEVLPMAVATDRYMLLLERGDHYFGGLIQKEVDAEDDVEGLNIFNAVSTAFLDAYVKESAAARGYLQTVDMPLVTGGRALLTQAE